MMTPAEERHADDALAAMHKLRDVLVHRNANLAACRVDEILCDLEAFARAEVRMVS